MQAKQLLKPKTGVAEVDRHLAQMTDVLNPVLRAVASSAIQLTKVMDNKPGMKSVGSQTGGDLADTTTTFNVSGGTLLVLFCAQIWTGSTGLCTVGLKIDGASKLTAQQFFNEINSHKTLWNAGVITGLAAGSHTALATLGATSNSGSDDYFNLLIAELPQ